MQHIPKILVIGVSLVIAFTSARQARADTSTSGILPFTYAGRLSDSKEAAVVGPVDLEMKFYQVATGGTALTTQTSLAFAAVALDDGAFQVEARLTAADAAAVFAPGTTTYVEIIDKTHSTTYPRQKVAAVPFALRVPVDGQSVRFDGNGNLAVGPSAAPASNEFLTKNSAGDWIWAAPASTGGGTIADNAVATAKIAAAAVTADKLADGAITATKIASGAVGATGLADGAVTTLKIAAGAIGATGIASGAVTEAKIAAGAVGATGLANGAVTETKIAAGAVGATGLANGAVSAAKIAAGAVGATGLADGAVTSLKIASGAVGATGLADGSISDIKISGAAAIARSKLASGTSGQVVINDPTSGLLSSEAQLAASRGGTGVNAGAAAPGILLIGNGSGFSLNTLNGVNGIAITNGSGGITIGVGGGPLLVGSGAPTGPAYSFTGDSDTGVYRPAADTVAVATNGNERLTITPNGDVGIGTSSPTSKLQVAGALAMQTQFIDMGNSCNTAINASASSGSLVIFNGSSGSGSIVLAACSSEGQVLLVTNGTNCSLGVDNTNGNLATNTVFTINYGGSRVLTCHSGKWY